LRFLDLGKIYGVSVGDDGKTTVVRGLWIQKRGLSALRVGALNIQAGYTQFVLGPIPRVTVIGRFHILSAYTR
jgi:hypothetical protein